MPLSEKIKVRLNESSIEPEVLTDVNFGSLAHLKGYTLQQSADTLTTTFFWEAQAPAVSEQTVLVHLINQKGELVAQGDGPPRYGTYPTTFWEPGEVIPDEHKILLQEIEPGAYALAVGFYDPLTGERLQVRVKGEARPEGFSFPLELAP